MSNPMRAFEDVRSALLAAATPVADIEKVSTAAALGRVLAADQVSCLQVPPLDNSSMDGYAINTADVTAAGARLTVAQRIPAGAVGHTLARGTAARIFTGAPVPRGADAIVMQELCSTDGDSVVIDHVPKPGEWIRRAGEDIARGSTVLAAGVREVAAGDLSPKPPDAGPCRVGGLCKAAGVPPPARGAVFHR